MIAEAAGARTSAAEENSHSKLCPACGSRYPAFANYCPSDGRRLDDLSSPWVLDGGDPLIGLTIEGRYRVEQRLGQGGMGVVYAARHVVIDKAVAIKVLRCEHCDDPALVERFFREARAASRIGHPHIVDVNDCGKLDNGQVYLVMELLTGRTLADELRHLRREGPPMSLSRVRDLTLQMAHGLGAAHAKGIVHRDLKPANVFVVSPDAASQIADVNAYRNDFIKLLDFGIAKMSTAKTRLTRQGSVFGTPQYMSPEQAAGKDCDHRGDIYALGCILYELAAGEPPFAADTFARTLSKHLYEAPPPLAALCRDEEIIAAVEGPVMKMLAKSPNDRFASMDEVIATLGTSQRRRPSQTIVAVAATDDTMPFIEPAEAAAVAVKGEEPPAAYDARRSPELSSLEDLKSVRVHRGRMTLLIGVPLLGLIALAVGALLVGDRASLPAKQRAEPSARPSMGNERQLADTSARHDGSDVVPVEIETRPSGALVLIDGNPMGRSPLVVEVTANVEHRFLFRKEGYADVARHFLGEASRQRWIVPLRRLPRSPQPVDPSHEGKPTTTDLRNPFETQR